MGGTLCSNDAESSRVQCAPQFFYSSTSGSTPGFFFNSVACADGDYNLKATFTDETGMQAVEVMPVLIDNVNDPPTVYVPNPHDGGTVGVVATVLVYAEEDNPDDNVTEVGLDPPAWVASTSEERYRSPLSRQVVTEYTLVFPEVSSPTEVGIRAWARDSHGVVGDTTFVVTVDPCLTNPSSDLCVDLDADGIVAADDCDDLDPAVTRQRNVDSDMDGIDDCEDKCPDTYGTADLEGCPQKEELTTNVLSEVCQLLDPLQWCNISDTTMGGRLTCLAVLGLSCTIEFASEFYPALEVLDIIEDVACDVLPHAWEAKIAWEKQDNELMTTEITIVLKNIGTVAFDIFSEKILEKLNVLEKYKKLISLIECMDSALQLSDEILKALIPIVYDKVGGWVTFMGSPADLHAYDELGRHVGLTEQGTLETEIPDSYYGTLGHLTILALPDSEATYEFVLEGIEEGGVDFEIWVKEGDGRREIEYHNVQVNANTEARINARKGGDFIMEVDRDGDGLYEAMRAPDVMLTDSDGDGIEDKMDMCPFTPPGCEVNEWGCTVDSDSDGVCEAMDSCPETPPELGVNETGCPLEPLFADNMHPLFSPANGRRIDTALDWDQECPLCYAETAEFVDDPKGVFGKVARISVKGYGSGTQTTSLRINLTVPPGADVVSIPLATGLNGDPNETDAEDGVEIAVRDPASGQSVMTYASNVLETRLGWDYIVAFADVSEFGGRDVELIITLRQADVCGVYNLYDYPEDPTPKVTGSHPDPKPYHFLDVREGPHNGYGAGEDTYTMTFELPDEFELTDFNLYYGSYPRRMVINGHELSGQQVRASFPYRSMTYVNIPEPSMYMPINSNATAVSGYFAPGLNSISVTVYAEKPWEERPFDLHARFRIPLPAITSLILLLVGWGFCRPQDDEPSQR
jgi:hypothetical protein